MTVLNTFQLSNKVALITGSSAGIGFALARALGEPLRRVGLHPQPLERPEGLEGSQQQRQALAEHPCS